MLYAREEDRFRDCCPDCDRCPTAAANAGGSPPDRAALRAHWCENLVLMVVARSHGISKKKAALNPTMAPVQTGVSPSSCGCPDCHVCRRTTRRSRLSAELLLRVFLSDAFDSGPGSAPERRLKQRHAADDSEDLNDRSRAIHKPHFHRQSRPGSSDPGLTDHVFVNAI